MTPTRSPRRPAALGPSFVLVLAFACLASGASADPFFDLPNGERLYNSGVDLSGGIDQHYEMSLNPFAPGSTAANLNAVSYLSPNNADSAWIGPSFPNVNTPESVYRVRTIVDLTGVSLAGFSLVGYWISDNEGLDILVNGASTGFTNNGAHGSLPSAFEENRFVLNASTGLVAGPNTIEFEWGNGPAGGAGSQNPNPTHIRIEFVSAAAAVPIFGAPALVALVAGLAGVGIYASRRHERTRSV